MLFPHLYISLSALHLFMVIQIPLIYPIQHTQWHPQNKTPMGGREGEMQWRTAPETQLKHTIAGQEKIVSERVLLCILTSLIQAHVLLGNVALSIFCQHIPVHSLPGFPLTFLLISNVSFLPPSSPLPMP